MRTMCKLLAMLLALSMVACMVPAAFAAEESLIDETTVLTVGENKLTLLDGADYTLYLFEATEIGVYTLSVNEGATIGYWGAGTFYYANPNSTATSIEQEIKAVGQQMLIGIASENPNVTLTITKTGESGGVVVVTYTEYENLHTPSAELAYDGSFELTKVDITEKHTAVEGADGYYHLDSEDGPVLYVDLASEAFNLPGVYGLDGGQAATRLRANYDGTAYDFINAMREYAQVVDDSDYGIYPLTTDLMIFLKAYGDAQGWYSESLSTFEDILAGGFDADTAWMVLCLTGEASGEVSTDQTVTLVEGDNTVTLQPGITYYLTLDLGNLFDMTGVTLSWGEGVVVTCGGEVLASPYDLSNYSPRLGALIATVEAETSVVFTLTVPESEDTPNLTLGDNAIEVTDSWNGTEVHFTATEAGEYVLSAAEGEENADVYLLTAYGIEWVELPYTFTLAEGETIEFVILTADWEVDTIDLNLAKVGTEEPLEDYLTLVEGENAATLIPGTNYYLAIDLPGLFDLTGVTLSWSEGVTVTRNGEVLASPFDLGDYSPRMGALIVTVTEETAAVFTITVPEEEPAPELVLGDNAIEVTDTWNGTTVSFTATKAGEYVLSAAAGEENADIYLLTAYGSEWVELPYAVELAEGETIEFIVLTANWEADTINLNLAMTEEAEVIPPTGDLFVAVVLAALMSVTGLVVVGKKH